MYARIYLFGYYGFEFNFITLVAELDIKYLSKVINYTESRVSDL